MFVLPRPVYMSRSDRRPRGAFVQSLDLRECYTAQSFREWALQDEVKEQAEGVGYDD